MQIFYAPGIKDDIHYLDENESRHCIRVLRMTKGSIIRLVDGRGNLYEGYINDPDPRRCEIKLTNILQDFEKRNYGLHLAISPLKNFERFEWFVEKSVETGIDEITPVICKNTEKQGIKTERINNIIISAMKQSIKAVRPVLNRPVAFSEFINTDFPGIRMIAHCSRDFERSRIDTIYSKGEDAVIMIGPEGDFTAEEIALATGRGFRSVHLGKSRLRAETAGIASCLSVYFINQ